MQSRLFMVVLGLVVVLGGLAVFRISGANRASEPPPGQTFAYHCRVCDHTMEKTLKEVKGLVKLGLLVYRDDALPLVPCDQCGETRAEFLVSDPAGQDGTGED